MTKKAKLILIPAFALTLSAGAILCLHNPYDGKAETWSETTLRAEYDLGDEVVVPDKTCVVGGTTLTAEKKIVLPDGSAYTFANDNAKITLNSVGKYTVIYTAKNGTEVYSHEENFVVEQKLVTLGETSSIDYGKGEYALSDAMILTLGKGETVTFNKYFDMSLLDKTTPFASLFIDPQTRGTVDCETVSFRFTDILDPTQYFTINYKYVYILPGMSYVTTSACGQVSMGIESSGTAFYYHRGDIWGSPVSSSFVAKYDITEKENSDAVVQSFYYDYGENAVYTSPSLVGSSQIVADFDDPTHFLTGVWSGFPSGKAYLSIYGEGWNKNSTRICFKNILGYTQEDLENCLQGTVKDEVAPELKVEAPQTMPTARVGYYYSVPKATAWDIFTGKCEVYEEVLFNGKTQVDVVDGKFKVTEKGIYTINYKAKDGNGNETKTTLTVEATDDIPELELELSSGAKTEAVCGEFVEVKAPAVMQGGSGSLTLKTTVSFGKETTEITNGFRPEKAGTYTVKYTVTDYTGFSVEKSYSVVVTLGDKPILAKTLSFPKYLLNGSGYTVDDTVCLDYTTGSVVEKKVQIELTDLKGTKTYSAGEKFYPSVENNGDTVQVNFVCDGVMIESLTIPVLCPYNAEEELCIENYFVTTAGTVTNVNKTQSGIVFHAEDDYSLTFGKDLAGNGFTMEIGASVGGAEFKSVAVTLTDFDNESLSLTMEVYCDDGAYYFQHGDMRVKIAQNLNDGNSVLALGYSSGRITYGSANTKVSYYDNGETFGGFPSNKVYVSMSVVSDNATDMKVVSICGYPFTRAVTDRVPPQFVVLGEYGGAYALNDTYVITPAVASDVLDPDVSISLTVIDPDKKIVTTVP